MKIKSTPVPRHLRGFTAREVAIAEQVFNALRDKRLKTGRSVDPWNETLPDLQHDWCMMARAAIAAVAMVKP